MTTDYDERRRSESDETVPEAVMALKGNRRPRGLDPAEPNDLDPSHPVEPPDGYLDVLREQPAVKVEAKRDDEFVCRICFLVSHRSRLAGAVEGVLTCKDCA